MRLRSWLRALILIAVVLDLPLLGRFVRALTREPVSEQIQMEDVAVDIVRPAGSGPWPAWLFVNGAHPLRRNEPVVARLSHGLARAGYIVFVPDVPGLGEGAITARTLDATFAVTDAAMNHPEVRGGRVALIGASTGAALALLAAARDEHAGRISIVAAVAPFADLERMVCLATTRTYADNGGFSAFEVTDLHRRVVARSLVATIPLAEERKPLLDALDRAERDEQDALDALPAPTETLSREAQAVLRVLKNDVPERFSEVYSTLPQPVLALFARLSPVVGCREVAAPVELVVPPSDVYFPPGEAVALAAALPNVHLTVTATLDHTRPRFAVTHLRSMTRFAAFVVRGLAAAA
jgi:acetyl esterase/lipase